MGKQRVIAETGAGQHGVAAATACALLGLECVVYMGTEDMRRQAPNVERMRLLGAEVSPGRGRGPDPEGGGERRDPRLGDQRRLDPLHHRLGRRPGAVPGAGARPPAGDRRRGARAGARSRGRRFRRASSPASAAARTRSGPSTRSSTTPSVELIGIEAGGEGLDGLHGASLVAGRTGVLHGALSSVLADEDGQILEAHSISAGLDYPGRRPRARPAARHAAGRATRPSPTPRRCAPSASWRGWRGSSRRWSPPTRSPGCWRGRQPPAAPPRRGL